MGLSRRRIAGRDDWELLLKQEEADHHGHSAGWIDSGQILKNNVLYDTLGVWGALSFLHVFIQGLVAFLGSNTSESRKN